MRIVVFDPDASACARLAAPLRVAGHELILTSDEGAAISALSVGPADAGLLRAEDGAFNVAKRLRGVSSGRSVHLLLVASQVTDALLLKGYEAGFDAELRLPCSDAVLVARMAALARSLGRPLGGVQKASGAAQGKPDTPLERVAFSQTWRGAASAIQAAAAKFLSLPASVEAAPPSGTFAFGAEILLASGQSELELRVALAVDAPTARALAVHLFGNEGASLEADMLSELSNIFMGTLKSAFNAESFAFASGLPQAVPPDTVLRPAVPFAHQEVFTLRLNDARVAVHLGVRAKGNMPITVAGLREGMVLVKDLYNARGMLLLNGGTRLSATMVERLKGALLPTFSVEISAI